jgi:hypothetical protein
VKFSKRKLVSMFVFTLLTTSLAFVQVGVELSDIGYIEPQVIYPNVGENFTVTVLVNVTVPADAFSFKLLFDPTQMSAINATRIPPWTVSYSIGVDYIEVNGFRGDIPPPGTLSLANVTFHCSAWGSSELLFEYVMFPGFPWQGATVHQQWYFKASYEDYAPSGVPDFDQRQDNWINPAKGTWSWCGPVAVANSLWWFDSKFEPNPVPPPAINDGFPLVTTYDPAWDDHDPDNVEHFVNDLAMLMDTDGQRTGSTHSGTKVSDMEAGIEEYLVNKGLDSMFYVKTVKAPDEVLISNEVLISEDVILLLGFWQEDEGEWIRIGGHFVTVPGVNPPTAIAFSDPIKDNAELGYPGRVIPPPPHPHNPAPPYPLHNNASYVSHDFYDFDPAPVGFPGGIAVWGPKNYNVEDLIENFSSQNIPEEFEGETGPYNPTLPVHIEVEYAVIVSPIRDVAITNVTPAKTVVGQNCTMDINATVTNEGSLTETFNVTTYYNATFLSEGFESGTFAGWNFSYSTNGAQSGSVPSGTWSSSIVSGANALSGTYSAKLFADSDVSVAPWRVDAAINQTIRRSGATDLKAMIEFDQITDPGAAAGHAFLYISVVNAHDPSESISYGFDNSTLLTPGDISYNVSPGDLVNFEADIAADYFNKYGKALPKEVIVRFQVSADYAEPSPGRQTIEVRLDDIAIVVPSTPIQTKTVTVTGGNFNIITFTWNTTGVPYGNYTINAVAEIVPGETDPTDNTLINGWVVVTIAGDVDGDGDVDRYDFGIFAVAYGRYAGDPNYDGNCDFDSDNDVDRYDFGTFAANYGKTDP